jgi:hypothetical protein
LVDLLSIVKEAYLEGSFLGRNSCGSCNSNSRNWIHGLDLGTLMLPVLISLDSLTMVYPSLALSHRNIANITITVGAVFFNCTVRKRMNDAITSRMRIVRQGVGPVCPVK